MFCQSLSFSEYISNLFEDLKVGKYRLIIESVLNMNSVFQGHLGKKMDLLPAFREHFFVLQPHLLAMFSGSSEKEKKGEILIDGQCR